MKKDWEIKKLGEVCTYFKQQGKYDDLPYVGMEDIESKTGIFLGSENISSVQSSTFFFEKNDVLFGRLRPYLAKVYLAEFSGHCSTEIFPIRVKKDLLASYLKLWLLSDKTINSINETCTGARMPRADMNEVLSFEVPVPPLEEQKRIVKILDEKFAQLESLKANAQTNLHNAKDLFQSQLAKAFNNTTWEKKRLFEICQNIVDCPHTTPKKSVVPTDYPCIRTSELKNGEIDWTTMQYLKKEEYLKRITRLEPKENDIVYGREGTFGDAVLLPNTHHFSLGQRTMLLRPNSDIINPKFLLKAIISPYVYKQALEKNNGCGVPHVNVADVKNFIIPVPSAEIQKRIVNELDSISEKVKALCTIYEKQIADCDELKQAYLQKAFEGEL